MRYLSMLPLSLPQEKRGERRVESGEWRVERREQKPHSHSSLFLFTPHPSLSLHSSLFFSLPFSLFLVYQDGPG
jgi:hypothetical protein